jgi:hypothetical protein
MVTSPKAVKSTRHAKVLTAFRTAADATDPYREGLWTVVLYAAQVRAYQLPTLNNPDQWPGGAKAYAQAQDTWANTTGTLQGWSLSTLRNVIAIPQELINASSQNIIPGLNASIEITRLLINNPSSPSLRSALNGQLQLLNILFGSYSSQISALITSLEGQATVFDADAQVMKTLAAQALATAGNEKHLIEQLNQKIDSLNADIKAAAVAIAGGSLVGVLGIGMGILAVVLAPATGGVSLFLLVPAILITAGGAAIIALNAKKIEDDKAAIAALNGQIGKASGDITLLNAMSQTLTGFAGQVDKLKSALGAIVAPWQASENYLTTTINQINTIEKPTTENWTQVEGELNDILTGWNNLITEMNRLKADAQVAPNSNLQIGMSSEQVQQAMNSAPKVSLLQYLTAA